VVDPYEVAATFGADAFRFFLFREVPFGLDGDFSREAVINRINNDLANDFGNLASRTFAMIDKYCHGLVPEPGAVEVEMKELAESIKPEVEESLLLLDFHKALDQIWRLVSHANRYIDAAAPWVLARDPSKKTQLESVLYSCVEALRFLCLYLFPFMPNTTRQLWEQLGIASTLEDESLDRAAVWGLLQPGTKIKKRDSLFPRIEKTAQKSRENANKEEGYEMSETGNGLINIDNFAKVELKVGIVVSAEKVEKSNKLIKLQVDTGEMRQVVAGIGKAYRPEELIGKRIIVLTNLQPARLMGVESQGMLLAASESDSFISVLTLDREIKPGTRIR
jgi:methionyl-tRNA synthetase